MDRIINNDKDSGYKTSSIVIAVAVCLTIILLTMGSISTSMKYDKLKKEISRVASESGIEPKSIECRDVELASICYADYGLLSQKNEVKMLTDSGYKFDKSGMSAKNETSKTSIGFEPLSGSGPKVIKFKDINVTL